MDSGAIHYYVSPTGADADGNGGAERPWRTLAFAAQRVPPVPGGAIIHLAAGVYPETEPTRLSPGVSIVGAGREQTVLSARLPDAYLIQLHSAVNREGGQTLSGFTIDGNAKALRGGLWVENRNHVTLSDLAFLRCDESGSVVTAESGRPEHVPPTAYVRGTRILNCVYTDCSRAYSRVNADGIEEVQEMRGNCRIGGLDGAELRDLVINDATGGYGIKFIDSGFYRNVAIRDCRIRVNPTAPRWVACCALELWNVGEGCEVSGIDANTWLSFVNNSTGSAAARDTRNLKVFGCRILGKVGGSGQEAVEISMPGVEVFNNHFERVGIGIAFWGQGHNIVVRHNRFVNPVLTPMPWGQHTPLFFEVRESPHDTQCSYRQVRVHDNVFDTYEVGAFFWSHGGGATLDDIAIENNRFVNMARAISEAGGEAGNIRGVRLTGNHRNNAVPWVRHLGAGAADITADHNHGPSDAALPPPVDARHPAPLAVGATVMPGL